MKELTFQKDILGILVAHSYQYNSGIDIDPVLCYPLAPVSVPLSTPDGSIRKTVKSKLFKAAMSDLSIVTDEDLPGHDRLRTYFLDLAAAVRTIVGKPETVSELAARILVMVPHQSKDIYIACDTYEENSIKGGERVARGTSECYFLRSPDMKIPRYQDKKPPDKNPLDINPQTKTPWTKTPLAKNFPDKNPQRKLINTKYILHK